MKTLILFICLITLDATASFAQCDKKVKFTSSKTTHYDASGNVIKTDFETSVVQISKAGIIITVGGEERINIAIKSMACNWTVPFKEGKTDIKGTATNGQGDQMNISLMIEGKAGKVTAQFVVEGGEDDVIRVVPDKFEEDI